jgi:hypothetical protein
MKVILLLIVIFLAAPLAFAADFVPGAGNEDGETEQLERAVAAEPNVIVTVCLASGDVIVHGWDRPEVRARTTYAEQLELSRGAAAGAAAPPASRVEVIISDAPPRPGQKADLTDDCNASSDLMLDVPRGATVEVKTRDGAVEVTDVADARLETLSGDIAASGISKRVEAQSVSGDVSLANSSGPVRLRSITGSLEASNARTIEATDGCEANTVSGDVILDQIGHARVEARTVSGSVSLKGALARGGRYEFKTTSGDMMFTLPADASFRINARLPQGEIITDFSLKGTSAMTDSIPDTQFLTGTHGTGDATLDLYSFNGTVHLRRNPR